MRVGYARVSTTEQSIEAQLGRLSECERVFSEKLSGKTADRPELARALEFVRQGDQLVATRLDRLARSVSHLCSIAETLQRKGVELQILDQAIDTSTPAGKFLFHMLAAVAEFELSIRKEAQRAGIAHAKAAGKRTGRESKLGPEQRTVLRAMRHDGYTYAALCRHFRVSDATVRRALVEDTPPALTLRSG